MARRFQPRLNKRLLERRDAYRIYAVNAFAVRNRAEADVKFTSFATHDELPDLIAQDEVWIWDNVAAREGDFFIANALTELQQQAAGASKSEAEEAGLAMERLMREHATGAKYRNGKPHRQVPDEIRVSHYLTLEDPRFPIEVWLVDGLWVRSLYQTDYNDGGHGYVYAWCPKREIWMEKDLDRAELPLLVAHEYVELRLMRDKGLKYDKAHEIASEVEYDLRKSATRSRFPGLSRQRLTKRDVRKFTADDFFEYVQRNYQHGLMRRAIALVDKVSAKILP
jgi:hypothetical protein